MSQTLDCEISSRVTKWTSHCLVGSQPKPDLTHALHRHSTTFVGGGLKEDYIYKESESEEDLKTA